MVLEHGSFGNKNQKLSLGGYELGCRSWHLRVTRHWLAKEHQRAPSFHWTQKLELS